MKRIVISFLCISYISLLFAVPPCITINTTASNIHMIIKSVSDYTPIQVDFGDGVLVNDTIHYSYGDINGFMTGTNILKIYGSGIRSIDCYQHDITSMDLSQAADLEYLYAKNNQLTSLDISNNTQIEYVNVIDNMLTSFTVPNNSSLKELLCEENLITTLSIGTPNKIVNFNCGNNLISSLDATNLDSLEILYCDYNDLSTLNLSNCDKLTTLNCSDNELTTLILGDTTNLSSVNCTYNSLTLSSLPILPSVDYYDYYAQKWIVLPDNINVGQTVDLSAFQYINGKETSYLWKEAHFGATLVEGVDYTITNGITTFLKAHPADQVWCIMQNETFPYFDIYNTFQTEYATVSGSSGIKEQEKLALISVQNHSIDILTNDYKNIVISDISGKTIYMGKSKHITIPLQGIYFVVVESESGIYSEKIFIK